MKNVVHAVLAASSCLVFATTALAADLKDAELKDLIAGKTVYLELGAGSIAGAPGLGHIYYNADGVALYKTAKGETWHGQWSIKDNTVCNVWKEAAVNSCTRYDKQGDVLAIIAVTGQVRGKVLKTAPGNPEKLVP